MTDHAESKKNAKNLVAELFIQRIEINDFNKEKSKENNVYQIENRMKNSLLGTPKATEDL